MEFSPKRPTKNFSILYVLGPYRDSQNPDVTRGLQGGALSTPLVRRDVFEHATCHNLNYEEYVRSLKVQCTQLNDFYCSTFVLRISDIAIRFHGALTGVWPLKYSCSLKFLERYRSVLQHVTLTL